jgi:hypothetical protein
MSRVHRRVGEKLCVCVAGMQLVIGIRARAVEEGQGRKERFRVDRWPQRAGWYTDTV